MRFLGGWLVAPGEEVVECLKGNRYVGAVREVPLRNHEASRSAASGRWANGLGAWDRLLVDASLVKAANQWLLGQERFDAGYEINVKQYKELDMEDPLALQILQWDEDLGYVQDPRSWFENLPTQSKITLLKYPELLEHQPADIGIGLAKMIPVLVAALDPVSGVVLIEEPEANIHPRRQVVLGDLFIAQGVHNHQCFLVETHSEHLVLRLLRRIRETAAGEVAAELALAPNDVNILYVENDGQQVVIHTLRVGEDGEFIDRWPQGFFAERGQELF